MVSADRPLAAPVLRAATPGDEAFLRELYRSTRIAELRVLPWSDAQIDAFCNSQFDAQTVGYRSAFPQAEHLIICCGEERAGRLIKARIEEGLLLVDLGLLPAYRNRGWGSRLVRALQDEARRSAIALLLQVERNSPALALYRRLGFAIVGEDGVHLALRWTAPAAESP